MSNNISDRPHLGPRVVNVANAGAVRIAGESLLVREARLIKHYREIGRVDVIRLMNYDPATGNYTVDEDTLVKHGILRRDK